MTGSVSSRVFLAATLMLLAFAEPATAATPTVERPVPQPFNLTTDCYKLCGSPALLRTTTPTLAVAVNGTPGYFLYTAFEIRTGGRIVTSVDGVQNYPPGIATWRVPEGVLGPETFYVWRARSRSESGVVGGWSDWRAFAIDVTPPGPVTVSSTEYPERQWGAELGTAGTFHFSSDSFDVTEFVHYIDPNPWNTVSATGGRPRTATVTMTPPRDGANVLNVYALDAAGNRSDTYPYQFYVTPPPLRFSHWTLDDTAADSGTIGADGTLAGEVAFGPGYLGGSPGAVFNGGRIATAATVLDTTKSFTVMGWVSSADVAAGPQTVAEQDGFRLYLDPAGWCASLGTAKTCVGVPVSDRWTHVAIRYDAIPGTLAVYVMGGPNECSGQSAATASSPATSSGPFVIGDGWRGSIDDVQAHQRALEPDEICWHARW